ncbi:Ig-like domain-containing protein [Ellagibacter isourolithinifaciens]|uniref:Ig-like domain-containing protein n=1 Tax=Ellagibacter isourolithinifaciens TaxID=2137581 RepID=UPI003A8CC014
MVAAIAAICFAAFRPIPVDTLSITQADKEVYVGYPSSPVKVAYTPTDARQTEITWSSSDESVATVDSDGIVNAMGTGTATITAEAESGATATCEMQCYAIPNFKQIVKDKCNDDSTYCTVAPDGLSLQIDTNPTDSKSDITQSWGDVVASPYVQATNKALGLPDSLWNSMKNTTGSQGKQTKTYGIIEASWSYLPRHGLEVLYENASGKTPVSGTTA